MSRRRGMNNVNRIGVRNMAKRPIDKELISITSAVVSGTQLDTELTTASFPNTVTGIRWSFGLLTSTAAPTCFYWAILVVKDGNAPNNFATSTGSSFYQPEQDVLAFGAGVTDGNANDDGPVTLHFEGSTKSMRKLMAGDKLYFCLLSEGGSGNACGVIQFFSKS